MNKPWPYIYFVFIITAILLPGKSIFSQLTLSNLNASAVIDFSALTPATVGTNPNSAFNGSGFEPNPTQLGRLNSNAWAVTGWSDGSLTFGGTENSASTDYTRGSTATAVTIGGIYAYTGTPQSITNPCMMIQPGGSDFAPGTLTLRILNNGSTDINQLSVSYNLFIRNDQGRSTSFNFSYSSDNSVFTQVPALDYISPVSADANGWVQVNAPASRNASITGLAITPGSYFYIRWSSNDVAGSGNRDEIGLDDISVAAQFAPGTSYSGITSGAGIEPATVSSLINSQAASVLNFDFTVTDDANTGAGDDNLPTLINQIIIQQGSGNAITDWSQALAGAVLTDGTYSLNGTITGTNITFSSINIANLGHISDDVSKTYTLKIWLKNTLGGSLPATIDGLVLAFRIDRTNFTTSGSTSSTQFETGAGMAVESGSMNNLITVLATNLAFVQQPSNTPAGATINPHVSVQAVDANGNRDLDFISSVTLTLSTTTCGYLTGYTETAGYGLSTFVSLAPQVAETGITLTAASSGLITTVSSSFNVTGSGSVYATLVYWNFDDKNGTADGGIPSNASKSLSVSTGVSNLAYIISGAGGSGSFAAWADTWNNGSGAKYWLIDFTTVGYTTLKLSSKERSSPTGPRDYKIQYKVGSGAWTDLTTVPQLADNFTAGVVTNFALPTACENQTQIFIRWIMYSNVSVSGGTVASTGTSRIDDIIITGVSASPGSQLYYRSKASGSFESACNWEASADNISWYQAPVSPGFTSNTITIQNMHTISINTAVTLDEVIINYGGTLILNDTKLTLNNGSGTDLTVNGTFTDNASSANNAIFNVGATWVLGTNGTYIKTRNSSAMVYRDGYEGGMINIPATANWIIRYIGASDVTFTTTNATYYPNLTFENVANTANFSFITRFTGISDFARIKGNLDIGGAGIGSVTVKNDNTNASALLIQGNLNIKSQNVLTNNGTGTGFEVKGNVIADGTFTSNGSGILVISGNVLQDISGTGTLNLQNITISNNSTGVTLSRNLSVPGILSLQSSTLSIQNNILSLSGTINTTSGSLTGSSQSDLQITGSGSLSGNLKFASTPATASTLQNLYINRVATGLVTLGSDLTVSGMFTPVAGIFSIGSNTLTLNGNINNSPGNTGTLTGTSSSNLYIGGTSASSLGTLTFTGGTGDLNLLTIDRTITNSTTPAVVLGSVLKIESLNLLKGIIATANNLLIWNNSGGTLSQPSTYTDSYICLCNASGSSPVSFTKPFDGSKGFRIKNVGSNIYFPIGIDFNSPNRMFINNTGDTDSLTVVMEKGDIGSTDKPRVNRIWYVKQGNETARHFKADMRLYFTKRDWTNFPFAEDEVESGFSYNDVHLVQKNYNDPNYIDVSTGADIKQFVVADGTEIFGQYTLNTSPDYQMNTDGINIFTRFSVVNISDIILPVKLINFKAYRQANIINLEWTSLNENNVALYEVQRAANANDFKTIFSLPASANGAVSKNYTIADAFPPAGITYYRIKAVDKDGKSTLTNILKVDEAGQHSDITIFPNPLKGKVFYMHFTNLKEGNYKVSLVSANGKILYSQTITYPGGSSDYPFILHKPLAKGIYYLRITNGKTIAEKKLLIE